MINPLDFPSIEQFIIATNLVKLDKYTKEILLEDKAENTVGVYST